MTYRDLVNEHLHYYDNGRGIIKGVVCFRIYCISMLGNKEGIDTEVNRDKLFACLRRNGMETHLNEVQDRLDRKQKPAC